MTHNIVQKQEKETRHNCDRACILGLTKRTEARENSYWTLLIEQRRMNYKKNQRIKEQHKHIHVIKDQTKSRTKTMSQTYYTRNNVPKR